MRSHLDNNISQMELYDKEIEKLFAFAPSYQVVGGEAYHPGLDAMINFDLFLGRPHLKYPTIHVAGTNGKGSVSHFLASILSSAGYKVGLYTSPHLIDFRERIRINGEMIPREEVLAFLDKSEGWIKEHRLSFFEITTGMAFSYFEKEGVDVAIIEVGLGGRLDSTNIITPELSIITSIGLDHCQLLGNSKEEVAFEKGGIIKKGVPVVVGEVTSSVEDVLTNLAKERGSEIYFSKGSSESAQGYNIDLSRMDLKGEYQRINLKTLFTALNILSESPRFSLLSKMDSSSISEAIYHTAKVTGLRGRWEKLSETPLVLCDIAHNSEGLSLVMSQLTELHAERGGRLVIIFGMVRDKDITGVGKLLPKSAEYIFTQAHGERAMPSDELSRLLGVGENGIITHSVGDAIKEYYSNSHPDDLLFIGGSSFVVAEALKFFIKN